MDRYYKTDKQKYPNLASFQDWFFRKYPICIVIPRGIGSKWLGMSERQQEAYLVEHKILEGLDQ